VVVVGAVAVDVVVGAGGLVAELVAGEVEDHKAAVFIELVDALEVGVLRGVAALGGGVDHKEHLAAILGKGDAVAVSVEDGELVDVVGRLLRDDGVGDDGVVDGLLLCGGVLFVAAWKGDYGRQGENPAQMKNVSHVVNMLFYWILCIVIQSLCRDKNTTFF